MSEYTFTINTISLFWNVIIIILIICSLLLWYSSYTKTIDYQKPIIEYRDSPLPLDIQFSKENFPTVVYNPLFTGPNPWIGGFNLPGDKDQRSQKIPQTNFSH